MLIRPAEPRDRPAIASIIMPTIFAGETYALDPAMRRERRARLLARADRETFVAEVDGVVVGTFSSAQTKLVAVAMFATAAT